jgi:hypothetical protein
MDIRAKIREMLSKEYGNFETYLEHVYENKLTENLAGGNIKNKKEWLTYNQVVLELKNSIKDTIKVKELQYKLTEDSDPNKVCIEVIKNIKHYSPELERLYHKIKNFK